MNLHDLLNDKPTGTTKHCQFAPWLATLPSDDQTAVWAAFDNPEIQSRHIFRVLRDQGCPSGESSIRAHRKGECKQCERNRNNV